MSLKIIEERFETYQCKTLQDIENALKEISQEIALAALARTNFFKQAAFQGGSALRILYSLNRFSEDLDFVLKEPDPHFQWGPFSKQVQEEFRAFGMEASFEDRSKVNNAVKKIFLKDTSLGRLLHVKLKDPDQKIKIKLELDTNPPLESSFETKYLDFPFPFAITTQDGPSLFGSKSHALLCREYVKGRDWYDFIWYTTRKVKPNLKLLSHALDQQGPWKGKNIQVTEIFYVNEMEKKIKSVDWEEAKKDVRRFIKPYELASLNLWNEEFFSACLKKLELSSW